MDEKETTEKRDKICRMDVKTALVEGAIASFGIQTPVPCSLAQRWKMQNFMFDTCMACIERLEREDHELELKLIENSSI